MYFFFEKGMRGRISYICKRCSKANNNFLKSHDPKRESKHIIYLDVNKKRTFPIIKTELYLKLGLS